MIEISFNCCAFCPTESKNLYKCSSCKKFYCNLRCFRSKKHLECSEKFYKKQCEQMEKVGENQSFKKKNEVNRPKTTFEEYMKNYKSTLQEGPNAELNPQIKINSNEQILFDSDDEPDYLLDVVSTTMNEYEKVDLDEINRRLLNVGLSPGLGINPETMSEEENQKLMEDLYLQLNADERKVFSKLADEMLNSENTNQSCFRKKKK